MSPKILNLAFLSLISLTPHVLALKDSSACYNSPGDLTLADSSQFMTVGMCKEKCTNAVRALQGTDCYCGSSLPPSSAKVPNDKCDTPCPGYPTDNCGGSKAWTVMYDTLALEQDSEGSGSTFTSLTVNPSLVATITKDSANPTATIPAEILTAPSATFTKHPGVAHGVSSGPASSSVAAAAAAAAASKSAGASASASSSTPSASPSNSAGAAATLSGSVGVAGSVVGMVFLPLVMAWF